MAFLSKARFFYAVFTTLCCFCIIGEMSIGLSLGIEAAERLKQRIEVGGGGGAGVGGGGLHCN